MQLTPLPGHVYVEVVERQPPSGLAIVGTNTADQRAGRIAAVASHKRIPSDCCPVCCPSFKEGMDTAPMDSRVGDYAVFRKHSGDIITIKGRTFLNILEDELLATMDEATFHQLTPA